MSISVVSALERKRRVLAEEFRSLYAHVAQAADMIGTLHTLDTEIARLRAEIEGLEVSLKTFCPYWLPPQIYRRPKTKRSPFAKGQIRSHIMEILREADRAWTQADLLDEVIKRHVRQQLDHRDRGNLQVGLRGQLKRDFEKGLLERLESPERWRLIRKSERTDSTSTPASTAVSDV